jgi:hypothetical protein
MYNDSLPHTKSIVPTFDLDTNLGEASSFHRGSPVDRKGGQENRSLFVLMCVDLIHG